MFSQVCVCSTFGGGGGQYPVSGPGGYPVSGLGGGSRSQVQGGTQSQVWGGSRSQVWGGTQSQVWGVPCFRSRRVPHLRSGGLPVVLPPGIARTCYGHAAGGMPLAFTQEDFLVAFDIKILKSQNSAHETHSLLKNVFLLLTFSGSFLVLHLLTSWQSPC